MGRGTTSILLITILLVLGTQAGCSLKNSVAPAAATLTPAARAQIGQLRGELSVLQSEIAAADEQQAEFAAASNLRAVDATKTRIEDLNVMLGLVEERIGMLQTGESIEVTAGSQPDPEAVAALDLVIERQEGVVTAARRDVETWNNPFGGPVYAEMTLALDQAVLTTLRCQRLAAKYGLPIPGGIWSTATVDAFVAQQQAIEDAFEGIFDR